MLTFWGVITAVTVFGGVPTVAGLWAFERWRSRRRNRVGECASCGTSWRSTATGELYLIHGRLVCEQCAETARRRMPWHFGIIGTLAAAAGLAVAIGEGSLAMAILVPIGSTAVMTFGAVQLMKAANRGAQRRIAEGEFPDILALEPGAEDGDADNQPNASRSMLSHSSTLVSP